MFKDLSSRINTIYRKVKLSYSLVNQTATDSPRLPSSLPPAVYNIPPAVYDKLVQFKAKRGLQSVEMAVTVILSEYFGLSQTADATSRLASLEAQCVSLSETVAELRHAIAILQPSSHPPDLNPQVEQVQVAEPISLQLDHLEVADSTKVEAANEPAIQQPFLTPITQAALAKRLGVSTSSISRMQSKPNFAQWSQQKDPEGIVWMRSADSKGFYPQSNS